MSTLDVTIRPIRQGDADALHEMRIMPGVQETISGVYSERPAFAENYVNALTPDDHIFVAEVAAAEGGVVVGCVSINVDPRPRRRHVGVLGIMVRTEWQGKGIGRSLLERVVDLADNWLMLRRLELVAFAENESAIRLYESFGFQPEGTMREAMVLNGRYADSVFMGRLRLGENGKV